MLGGVHHTNSQAGASSLCIPVVYCNGHNTAIKEDAQVGEQTTNALGKLTLHNVAIIIVHDHKMVLVHNMLGNVR